MTTTAPVEALRRLAEATPQSTNTVSAEGAFAYVHAVARTALDDVAALTASPAPDEVRDALAGLLPWLEDAETKCLVGHEGCVWAVEQVRAALDGQPAQKPPQSPATDEGTVKSAHSDLRVGPHDFSPSKEDRSLCFRCDEAPERAIHTPATDDIGRLVERLQEASSTVISLSAAELCGAATALLSQQSEINRLRELLVPFAAFAPLLDPKGEDVTPFYTIDKMAGSATVTFGDFRRARAALPKAST